MGRLILNVLLSFAQFEREIISERTRDKIAATRRKGKWSGGAPILGYDIDAAHSRIVVNEVEAVQVRTIFQLYLAHGALLPVVRDLERRGWSHKCWQTKDGHTSGGACFTKTAIHRLLTNVVYIGKVRYREEVHDGVQPALIDLATWTRVQELLSRHGQEGGGPNRRVDEFLLRGLLRCGCCDSGMTPSQTPRGNCRYRYYVCIHAQKRGWDKCPTKAISAGPIEDYVVDQVRSLAAKEHAEASVALTTTWPSVIPRDQAKLLNLLIQSITYDGGTSKLAIHFHPNGLERLADKLTPTEVQ